MTSTEAHVVIEDRFYGAFTPGPDPRGVPALGIAYWCVSCARVWAVIHYPGRDTYPKCVPCRKHHVSPYLPGGSLWLPLDPHITSHFPKETLQYEMLRHLELFEQHPDDFSLPKLTPSRGIRELDTVQGAASGGEDEIC